MKFFMSSWSLYFCLPTCTPMFIAALFIIARTWKQPTCPSADEWIRKLWYIYTMEYYSAVKEFDFLNFKIIRRLPWLSGKESACQWRRHRFNPWSGKVPYVAEQLSLGATTIETVLQSLGATTTEARIPQSSCSATREATTRSLHTAIKSSPRSPQLENNLHSKEDSAQPK